MKTTTCLKPILGKVPTIAAQLRALNSRKPRKPSLPIIGHGQQIALRDGRANHDTMRAMGLVK